MTALPLDEAVVDDREEAEEVPVTVVLVFADTLTVEISHEEEILGVGVPLVEVLADELFEDEAVALVVADATLKTLVVVSAAFDRGFG